MFCLTKCLVFMKIANGMPQLKAYPSLVFRNAWNRWRSAVDFYPRLSPRPRAHHRRVLWTLHAFVRLSNRSSCHLTTHPERCHRSDCLKMSDICLKFVVVVNSTTKQMPIRNGYVRPTKIRVRVRVRKLYLKSVQWENNNTVALICNKCWSPTKAWICTLYTIYIYTYITPPKTKDRQPDRQESLHDDATSSHDYNPWRHQWPQTAVAPTIPSPQWKQKINYDRKLVHMWCARRNSTNRKKTR